MRFNSGAYSLMALFYLLKCPKERTPKKRREYMSLTRKFMQGMGLTEEQATAIIEANEETIAGLKAEIEKYKTASEESNKKLTKAQKELSEVKEEAEANEGKNPYKVKYEAIKEEFESYKEDIKNKETKRTKEDAFRALLKDVGVSEKRINSVVKVSDIDGIELDEDGKIKDASKLKESVKEEWSDFIQTKEVKGAETATPPANNGGTSVMTVDDIKKIKDDSERQKAWKEYLNSQNK